MRQVEFSKVLEKILQPVAQSFVISKNLKRRHLTISQQIAIAYEVLPMFEQEARERMESGINQHSSPTQRFAEGNKGEARQKVAQLFNTNRQYISDIKKIDKEYSDLVPKIKTGELRLRR